MSARVLLTLAVLVAGGCGDPIVPITDCREGAACGSGDPCTPGHLHCNDGRSICVTSPQPEGASCGDGKTCHNGLCVGGDSCTPGASCTLADACVTGEISCASGAPVCTPSTTPLPDGTACGAGACSHGVCVPPQQCIPGQPCKTDKVCHVGTSTCGADGPACDDSALAIDGTACGPDATCQSGICSTCKAGGSCSSPNVCMTAVITCSGGQSACTPTTPVDDGTACGTDQVCHGGSCVSCQAGVACKTACQVGEISCSRGFAECIPTGNQKDGTSCGSNQVCHAGVCGACSAGADCAVADACHAGKIDCSSGQPTCVDSGNRGPGVSCNGGNGVCDGNGSCVACHSGADCSTPCHPGTISCTTGAPVCVAGPPTADWASCGATAVCLSGICREEHFLTVVSGNNQSGLVGQTLTQPLVLHLADGKGNPVAGAFVGAGDTRVTDADGNATFTTVLYPDDAITYTWSAEEYTDASGLDARVNVTTTGVAPPAGTIMTLVNTSHQPGDMPTSLVRDEKAHVTQPTIFAATSSTLFFADGCRIFKLTGWTVSYVVGGDCAPSAGDGGSRRDVRFAEIRGLAFDATGNNLLVAEPDRVRSTSATSNNGAFTTTIGGPNPPMPGDGDGGPGTQAVLTDVRGVAVGPDGGIYVSANGRIRRWDRTTKNIQPWFTPTPASCSGANTVASCDHGCRVAWDAQKRPWITANMCGGGQSGRGLALLDQGAFGLVLGGPAAPMSDGTTIAYDGAGGILVTDPASQRVVRVDTLTSIAKPLAGNGTAGDAGDLGPATDALLRNPAAAVVFNGHTLISDSDNHCIRRVW